jgi:Fur family ferric uptake transcriptional regulator
MSAIVLLRDTLKSHGYSLTKPRRAVFETLQADGPLIMRDLVEKTMPKSDRASVYRTVELFEQLGIIIRLHQGFKYKLELSDLFTHHHHHLTCEVCGYSIAFSEPPGLDSLIRDIADKHNFVAHTHQLEIIGICTVCKHDHQHPHDEAGHMTV